MWRKMAEYTEVKSFIINYYVENWVRGNSKLTQNPNLSKKSIGMKNYRKSYFLCATFYHAPKCL